MPGFAGTASWSPGAGAPVAATAGPARLMAGDWNDPNPQVNRTLVRPLGDLDPLEAEPPRAAEREAHVIPQAPTLKLLAPTGGAPVTSRAMARVETPKRAQAAPPPAVSTQTARAQDPPEAPAPPVKKRRTLIPIPEPGRFGVVDARPAKPVFKAEIPVPPGWQPQAAPPPIAADPSKAVLLQDRRGDGYLTPVGVPGEVRSSSPTARGTYNQMR
ncbi:MAG: hypothetical protein HY553_21425 [Elusimicrobia bacterium]|nr:hypothetical protein [Elusimicrobiota bacterium]